MYAPLYSQIDFNQMNMSKPPAQSNLFLIRMWVDQDGGTQGEWHGKVQHMNSSQASSFEDWATLKEVLARMLDLDAGDERIYEDGMAGDEAQAPNYPAIFP